MNSQSIKGYESYDSVKTKTKKLKTTTHIYNNVKSKKYVLDF